MFNAGVPEKLIRDATGHRSSALQLYERPTTEQKEAVSWVLVQGQKTFTEGIMNKENKSAAVQKTISFSNLSNCNISIQVGSTGEVKTAQKVD